ncbi:MAG: hypothetical protein ACRD0O_03895 [Acidimicrobiia bacterium]
MTLSEYEELVVAELETQFPTDDIPPVLSGRWDRLALPAVCLLGAVGLLVAAHHTDLVIWMSDLWGFSTASVKTTLAWTGHGLLLGSAFLLGHVAHELRSSRRNPAAIDRPAVSVERV